MKLAICVVSPPGYVHSEAFRQVAETLHSAATALGHDALVTTESDLPGRRTVVLGTNLLVRHPQPLRQDAILYNLEQVQRGPWFDDAMIDLLKRYRVWDYSARNAEALERLGVPRPRVLPIGWAPELKRIPKRDEDIDVLFYGSINPRRKAVIDALRKSGARVETLLGVYGAERDAYIARSRLVLNVHYFEAKVFEIVRVSYLLANGRAVVSERGACTEEDVPFESGVAFANYEELVPRCLELLQSPEGREALAQRGQQLMQARPLVNDLQFVLEENESAPFVSVAATPSYFGREAAAVRLASPASSAEPVEAAAAVPEYYHWSRPEIVDFAQVQGKIVLDVGCAAGAMGSAMLANGAKEVVGIEVHADAAALARCRLTAVYQYDLDGLPDLPYPGGYFDAITFADVLEHLRDPEGVVRHLVRWLKPGGNIVCSIPNVRHQSVVLPLLLAGDWTYEDAGILDRTHLRFFTLSGIKRFCTTLGLEIALDVRVVTSAAAPELEELCAAVKALGGDADQFRREAVAVQYIFAARRTDQAVASATRAILDPWRGSRPTRLLLAPNVEDPCDNWERLLVGLASNSSLGEDVTVGIALPGALLRQPPLAVHQAAATGHLDLLLTEAPLERDGLTRLLGGTSILIATGDLCELRRIAREVGVKVIDGATLLRSG